MQIDTCRYTTPVYDVPQYHKDYQQLQRQEKLLRHSFLNCRNIVLIKCLILCFHKLSASARYLLTFSVYRFYDVHPRSPPGRNSRTEQVHQQAEGKGYQKYPRAQQGTCRQGSLSGIIGIDGVTEQETVQYERGRITQQQSQQTRQTSQHQILDEHLS